MEKVTPGIKDAAKPKRKTSKTAKKISKKDEVPIDKVPTWEMPQPNYYSLSNILKENADYNLIVGERGNGKTYAIQEYLLKRYIETKEQCFLLRRWVDDVKQSNAQNFWDGTLLNHLSEWTNGKFTSIVLRSSKYILISYDDKGKPIIDDSNVIGYVWDVNESERLKGQSFPFVTNIVFEEFISLSKDGYIPDELTLFLNIISTIVRDRTNVRVWLLGNSVNPYNPYFDHFGIKGMCLKQGEIWTKTEPSTGCKVAVEFCSKRRKGSLLGTSAKYYAFGSTDGSSDMIINGKWQLPKYPTMQYPKNDQLLRTIGVEFDDKHMLMKLFNRNGNRYLYVHFVKNFDNIRGKAILTFKRSYERNHFRTLESIPDCESKDCILQCLQNGKIWFSSNICGSYFGNFWSQSHRYIRDTTFP